jgi:hypothetical protein
MLPDTRAIAPAISAVFIDESPVEDKSNRSAAIC